MTEQENQLREIVEENHRALRGSNGTPGLVSDVSQLKADLQEIKDNHLPHILAEIGLKTNQVEQNMRKTLELEVFKLQSSLDRIELQRKATNWDKLLQIGTALAVAYLVFKHGL